MNQQPTEMDRILSQKRRADSPEDVPRKRASGESMYSNVNPTPNLLMLPTNCLSRIIGFMELSDLLNVADVNKAMKHEADLVFLMEHATKTVYFKQVHASATRLLECSVDIITIDDLSTALKMLRIFGRVISKIHVNFCHVESDHQAEIERYIIDFCSSHLIHLKLVSSSKEPFRNLRKSFRKLESLEIAYCRLGINFTDFNQWFPRLRRLDVSANNRLADQSCIAVHMPHLEYLAVKINIEVGFTQQNIIDALQLNPNLLHFKLCGDFDVKFIQSMAEYLLTAESLDVEFTTRVSDVKGKVVQFKNIRKFSVTLNQWDRPIPMAFGKLNELTLVRAMPFLPDNDIEYFMCKHSSVVKLNLDVPFFGFIDWITEKVAKMCRNVVEVNILEGKCSTYPVIALLKIWKKLKKITFVIDDDEFDKLYEHLDMEWVASKNGERVTLYRWFEPSEN